MKTNILLGIMLATFLSFGSVAESFTLHVVDDTYIDQSDTNYGSSEDLELGPNNRLIYARFDISELSENINREGIVFAKLRIYIKSVMTSGTVLVDMAGDQLWYEDEMIWDTRLGYWNTWGSTFVVDDSVSGSYLSVDITDMLKVARGRNYSNFTVHLRYQDGASATFASKESGWNAMQIEVLLNDNAEIAALQGAVALMDGELSTLQAQVEELKSLRIFDNPCSDGFEIITTIKKHGTIHSACKEIIIE